MENSTLVILIVGGLLALVVIAVIIFIIAKAQSKNLAMAKDISASTMSMVPKVGI